MRYLIKFSYNGHAILWISNTTRSKDNSRRTRKSFKKINDNKKVKVQASGRTDKGVHALGQTAHFDLDIKITEHKLKRALNSNLPKIFI